MPAAPDPLPLLLPPPEPKSRRAAVFAAAMLAAIVFHVVIGLCIRVTEERSKPLPPRRAVEMALIEKPRDQPTVPMVPEPKIEAAERPPEQKPPDTAPPQPARADAAEPTPPTAPKPEAAPPAAPAAAPPVQSPATAPDDDSSDRSVMRLPQDPNSIGKVLGTDKGLAPSAKALEGALDLKADGPVRDSVVAQRNIARFLDEDLGGAEVSAGLVDHYFDDLREHVERAWKPAKNQLRDGGKMVKTEGFLKDAFTPSRWNELGRIYERLVAGAARGNAQKLDTMREQKLKALGTDRKGLFRVSAIVELTLTQGPDGKVLTIDVTHESGHPQIDEGVRDSIIEAVKAMPDPPPPRVSKGKSFQSWWVLDATWVMIPPEAILSGAFDISSRGLEMPVPFDVKLSTTVKLLRTQNRAAAP